MWVASSTCTGADVAQHATINCRTGETESADGPDPAPEPQSFTPAQIVAAMDRMGVANVILANTDDLTKAKFYTASAVLETDERLRAALSAVGKTIADLNSNIDQG